MPPPQNVLARPAVLTSGAVLASVSAGCLIVYLALKAWVQRIGEYTVAPCTDPGCQLGSFADFRDATWQPVWWFLSGHDPYNSGAYLSQFPYAQDFPTYAPGHLAVWLPVGWLNWDAAVMADLLVNVVVVTAVGAWGGIRALQLWMPAWRSRPSVPLLVLSAASGVLLLWSSRAVSLAAHWGQPSVVYTVLAAPAVLVRDRRLAIALVALTCMKPQIGIVVLVVLLAQRRWREAVAGAGIAAAVSTVVVAVLSTRSGGLASWLTNLRENVVESADRRAHEWLGERIDLAGTLQDAGFSLAGYHSLLIALAGLGLAFAAVRWAARRDLPYTSVTLGFAIGTISIYHLGYDTAWLVIPTVLAAAELAKRGKRVFLATSPALSALLVAPVAARYHVIDEAFGAGTSINLMRGLLICGIAGLMVGLLVTLRDGGRHDAVREPALVGR